MPTSGTSGFVTVGSVQKPADKWNADLKQAAPDRSNFMTLGEPSNAAGQRTGEVTIEGPYEAVLGVDRGQLLTVGLGILPEIILLVVIRVTDYVVSNDKDTGPRWRITGAQYGAVSLGGVSALTGL